MRQLWVLAWVLVMCGAALVEFAPGEGRKEGPAGTRSVCGESERGHWFRSKLVNDDIMHTRSVAHLVALITAAHAAFDACNVNTSWRRLLLQRGHGGLAELPCPQSPCSADGEVERAVSLLATRALQLLQQERASPPFATKKTKSFSPREISNMLHALAKSGQPRLMALPASQRLVVALEERAVAMMPKFNGQDISNMMWAYARLLRPPSPQLLVALEHQALALLPHFTPQLVSNSLWAFATLKITPNESLLVGLLARAEEIVEEFNAQNTANFVWALATLRCMPADTLLARLVNHAVDLAGTFNGQNVANFLWAFTQFRVAPPGRLMETMEARSLARAASFTPEQLSNLMLSLATLGWVPREPLLEAMVARIAVTASAFNAQDIANSCWAMAVFIARGVPCYAFDAALKPLAHRSQVIKDEFLPQHNSALHLFALACDKAPSKRLHAQLQRRTKDLHALFLDPDTHVNASDTPVMSRSQMLVASALQTLGFDVQNEVICPQSGLSIDLRATVSPYPDSNQARVFSVEFDGPLHYMRLMADLSAPGWGWQPSASTAKAARSMTGTTELKHFLLRKYGHRLVVIPYWEWDAVADSPQAKRAYLRKKFGLNIDDVAPEKLLQAAAAIGVFTRDEFDAAERSGRLASALECLLDQEKSVVDADRAAAAVAGVTDASCQNVTARKNSECFRAVRVRGWGAGGDFTEYGDGARDRSHGCSRQRRRAGWECKGEGNSRPQSSWNLFSALQRPELSSMWPSASCSASATRCEGSDQIVTAPDEKLRSRECRRRCAR